MPRRRNANVKAVSTRRWHRPRAQSQARRAALQEIHRVEGRWFPFSSRWTYTIPPAGSNGNFTTTWHELPRPLNTQLPASQGGESGLEVWGMDSVLSLSVGQTSADLNDDPVHLVMATTRLKDPGPSVSDLPTLGAPVNAAGTTVVEGQLLQIANEWPWRRWYNIVLSRQSDGSFPRVAVMPFGWKLPVLRLHPGERYLVGLSAMASYSSTTITGTWTGRYRFLMRTRSGKAV